MSARKSNHGRVYVCVRETVHIVSACVRARVHAHMCVCVCLGLFHRTDQ